MKYTTATLTCDIPANLSAHSEEGEIETHEFALDGQDYEIDLCPRHATALADRFASYLDFASLVAPSERPYRPVRNTSSRKKSRAVRAWAREHGIELSDRGRIPDQVLAQYKGRSDAH